MRERGTTYSDVACQLIRKMKAQGGLPASDALSVRSCSSIEDDYGSEEPQDRKKKKSGTKQPSSQEDRPKEECKKEKNIKRRVYDALNVQLAAGVLQKSDHKLIMPNTENELFQRIERDLGLKVYRPAGTENYNAASSSVANRSNNNNVP